MPLHSLTNRPVQWGSSEELLWSHCTMVPQLMCPPCVYMGKENSLWIGMPQMLPLLLPNSQETSANQNAVQCTWY